jgi:flavin reductase (DIM6/NTAB) family NADH-FMN oxidoreductase RutF
MSETLSDVATGVAVDPALVDRFRTAFRTVAATVTIVTAAIDGRPVGFTATSLTSVSADPPMVSFAVADAASSWPAIAAARFVGVHLVDAGSASLAARFAARGADRFASPVRWRWTPRWDTPLLLDSAAHLQVEIVNRVAAGDHHIVIGKLLETTGDFTHEPLIYAQGGYTCLTS